MNELMLKGTKNIADMAFNDIEGGFGKNKKAMLAKDIATIHGREMGDINRRINENRQRFTDDVDILDVKGTEFAMSLVHSRIFTRNAVNAANNIYLLSERGYSKLLKILEDDVAWEKYEQLVDGYFSMRAEAKTVRRKSKDISVRQHLNIANTLVQVTGVKKEIAYAVAMEEAEKETGEDLAAYKKLLPSAEHETGFLNPTMIGERIGSNAVAVNKLLEKLNLQYRDEKKEWRITEQGKSYGEEFPYKRNNHTGYQIRWNEDIIRQLENNQQSA